MTRARPAAGLNLTGAPKLVADEPAAVPFVIPTPAGGGDVDDADLDLFGAMPEPPARARTRKKMDVYVRGDYTELCTRIVRYGSFYLGLKKAEVQEIILAVGLDNLMEIMRAMRARAGTGDDA